MEKHKIGRGVNDNRNEILGLRGKYNKLSKEEHKEV